MVFAREQALFDDRYDAGRQLAAALEDYKGQSVIVLAIPNGGVSVALGVALALEADLDLGISRKIPRQLKPEPVFGAGAFMPPPEYLPQLVNWLHEHYILWICDEVLVGFAKMGKWFAYQLFGDLKPDIMTIAKGLVSSALPAGCVVVSKEIADFMGKYRWMHIGTFNAHPVCMAAVCANLEVMIEENAPEKAQKAGEYFGAKLEELKAKHKTVALVSGNGLLWTVELVKNRETNEKFIPQDRRIAYSGDISNHPTAIIGAKCREKGVILAGFTPNTLRIGFSVFVTKEDMDKAIDALDYALDYLDTLA